MSVEQPTPAPPPPKPKAERPSWAWVGPMQTVCIRCGTPPVGGAPPLGSAEILDPHSRRVAPSSAKQERPGASLGKPGPGEEAA